MVQYLNRQLFLGPDVILQKNSTLKSLLQKKKKMCELNILKKICRVPASDLLQKKFKKEKKKETYILLLTLFLKVYFSILVMTYYSIWDPSATLFLFFFLTIFPKKSRPERREEITCWVGSKMLCFTAQSLFQMINWVRAAGKDWRQEEKEMTEDEMVGWHHWLNGHEFEQFREMVKDREAWHEAVHGVAKSWSQLSNWTATTKLAPGDQKYRLGRISKSLTSLCDLASRTHFMKFK